MENIRHVSFDEWKLQKVLNGKDISGSSLRLIGSSSIGTFKYKPTGCELKEDILIFCNDINDEENGETEVKSI